MSQAYFSKVRENLVHEIDGAPRGERNVALNKAAFTLGRHAHMDAGNIEATIIELHAAAKAIGLQEHEIKSTIGSGFKRGSENPKVLENADAVPFQPSEMDRLITRLAAKELLSRDDETRAAKIEKARASWERAVPINRDTKDACRPALLYLNSRGLRASVAAGVARFTPNLYDGPAIIFPALGDDGRVCGVQAVLLTPEGQKREHNGISKYSRGAISGSAMRIGDEHEGGAIIMVEGPEDALSVRQAVDGHAEATIICTFGKAGMSTYNPPRASDVTICADPDLDVAAVGDVLKGDGSVDVHVVRFDQQGFENVKDANDFLREAGAQKMREALAMAKRLDDVAAESKAVDVNLSDEVFFIAEAKPQLGSSYLIKNWFGWGQMSVVYGQSNVGKSFFMLDALYHVAAGRIWMGNRTKRSSVLYLATEGGNAFRNRAYAVGQKYGDVDVPLAVRASPVDLLDPDADVMKIAELAKQVEAHTGVPMGAICVDTLSRSMAGGNENSPEAMTAFILNCDRLRLETGCAVPIVHHSGKDTAAGARGHSSLRAACDTEVELEVAEDGVYRFAKATKQRDLQGGGVLTFKLEDFPLGTDEDGDPVSTAVVTPVDEEEASEARQKRPSGKNQRLILSAYKQLRSERVGHVNMAGAGWPEAGTRWIIQEAVLREHAFGKMTANNKRQTYTQALDGLISSGHMAMNDGFVWSTGVEGKVTSAS